MVRQEPDGPPRWENTDRDGTHWSVEIQAWVNSSRMHQGRAAAKDRKIIALEEVIRQLEGERDARPDLTAEEIKALLYVIRIASRALTDHNRRILESARAKLEAVVEHASASERLSKDLTDGNFVCEQHPNQRWPHDSCVGPGMLSSDVETREPS